jgi:hypothetical protein
MTTAESIVQSVPAIKGKQGPAAACASSPIRVRQSTKAKLDDFVRRANKQRVGRKIKPDDVICFSLDLLDDKHVDQICNKSLTNKDRMEMLFRKVAKEKRGISRDDFFGMLLDGKLSL